MYNLPCVICGKEISPLYSKEIHNDIVTNLNWENGDVTLLQCGYGSKYDMTNFVIAFCDNCLEKSLHDGRISILNYE